MSEKKRVQKKIVFSSLSALEYTFLRNESISFTSPPSFALQIQIIGLVGKCEWSVCMWFINHHRHHFSPYKVVQNTNLSRTGQSSSAALKPPSIRLSGFSSSGSVTTSKHHSHILTDPCCCPLLLFLLFTKLKLAGNETGSLVPLFFIFFSSLCWSAIATTTTTAAADQEEWEKEIYCLVHSNWRII